MIGMLWTLRHIEFWGFGFWHLDFWSRFLKWIDSFGTNHLNLSRLMPDFGLFNVSLGAHFLTFFSDFTFERCDQVWFKFQLTVFFFLFFYQKHALNALTFPFSLENLDKKFLFVQMNVLMSRHRSHPVTFSE